MDWSAEVTDKLRVLWAEKTSEGKDRYSTAALGRRFGVSKNAIVGKAHRIGCESRESPIRGHMAAIAKASPPAPPPSLPPLLSAKPLLPLACEATIVSWRASPPPKPKPMPVPIAVARPVVYGRVSECAWPIGMPGKPGFRFCCDKTEPGKPYCLAHCRDAFIRYQENA